MFFSELQNALKLFLRVSLMIEHYFCVLKANIVFFHIPARLLQCTHIVQVLLSLPVLTFPKQMAIMIVNAVFDISFCS